MLLHNSPSDVLEMIELIAHDPSRTERERLLDIRLTLQRQTCVRCGQLITSSNHHYVEHYDEFGLPEGPIHEDCCPCMQDVG